MSLPLEISTLARRGREIQPYLEALGRLRIEVFREFPYLYEGDLDYEMHYLQTYLQTENSFAFFVFQKDELVGATTAIAMEDEDPRFQKPLAEKGISAREVVYFGESILRGSLRGLGLGKRFMSERLAFARSLHGRRYAAFCSVIRPSDHPLRPSGYRPLDPFWQSQGFAKVPGAVADYDWKDIGEKQESTKKLQFWIRSLEDQ